jgi:transposase
MGAIFYVLRIGMPWRDLPERYGPYTTAYNRFNRWSRRGIWKRIFRTLASKSRDSLHLIDSTIVKAHRARRNRVPPVGWREVTLVRHGPRSVHSTAARSPGARFDHKPPR